jgi:RNA recognition motif-containing protein
MTIYVGNISYTLRRYYKDLRAGKVETIKLIATNYRQTKGYCFIEMPDKKEAMEAINTLDGKEALAEIRVSKHIPRRR